MPIRSAETVRTAALAVLESRLSGIRTDAGEPIVDLVDSFSIEAERGNVISDYLRRLNSIAGFRSMLADEGYKARVADAYGIGFDRTTADYIRELGAPADISSDVEALLFTDLNKFAASFGRPRRDATFATSTVRLILASSGAFSLSRGATVRRGSSSAVLYDSTETISITTPARDPSTGDFYVDVGVKCRTAGRVGNAIRGSINASVGNFPGVVSLSNIVVANGGFERESNSDLLDALELALSGANINTRQGLLTFASGQDGVADAVLVTPGDAIMTRSTAGAVDVYVIGSKLATDTAIAVVRVAGERFTLPFQPVQSISSVSDDSANSYFIGSIDDAGVVSGGFAVLPDTGSMSLSSKAHTQLQWGLPSPAGIGPAIGAKVTIVYTYDALVRNIQRKLDDDPQTNVPASAILTRLATLVGVACQLQVIPIAGVELLGFSQEDVNLAAESALRDYFDVLRLGAEADFSTALVRAAEAQISGVRVVDHIDDFAMTKVGGVPGFEDLKVAPNEYLRLDTVEFLS